MIENLCRRFGVAHTRRSRETCLRLFVKFSEKEEVPLATTLYGVRDACSSKYPWNSRAQWLALERVLEEIGESATHDHEGAEFGRQM